MSTTRRDFLKILVALGAVCTLPASVDLTENASKIVDIRNDNEWHHILFTKLGDKSTLMLDGAEVDEILGVDVDYKDGYIRLLYADVTVFSSAPKFEHQNLFTFSGSVRKPVDGSIHIAGVQAVTA